MAKKITLTKSAKLILPKKEELKLLVDFINYASEYLEFDGPFKICLLHAAPDEPITLGCYRTDKRDIRAVIEKRNFLDYCRTIAHEMVHQRQQSQNRIKTTTVEENDGIGGEIEDEANAVAGQIMKSFIKNKLNQDSRKTLGLGTYGT